MSPAKPKNLAIVIFLTFSIGSFTNCSDPSYRRFLIGVDSIKVTPEIIASMPFQIEFYGLIGRSDCVKFSHFHVNFYGSEIQIEAWKKLKYPAEFCKTEVVTLDGEILNYEIDTPGEYQILIRHPNRGFNLIENIIVK